MKFFLAGHVGLYNRGCEALVRGIVRSLGERYGRCEFVAPSTDVQADSRQWPDAAAHGVRFVSFYRIPPSIRWWDRATRGAPQVADWWWPLPDVPPELAAEIADADAMIVTGGDVLSLDYSLGSLLRWVAQAEAGLRRGVPVVLWASSVGPFSAMPAIERRMAAHLARYASLTTRESHSQAYLRSLGLEGSELTADPAFLMEPEPVPLDALMPQPGPNGILGFNVSPVVARTRARSGALEALEDDVVAFWRAAIHDHGLAVALVPHVDPPGGEGEQSDTAYMRRLVQRATDLGARLKLLPHDLNAAQLKSALAACRYFVGARTHATIGAMSSGVPTLSIAYSVKAKGINEDLFGHLDYLIETPAVSLRTLREGLQRLAGGEAEIRATLRERIPQWRKRAGRTADLVARALQSDVLKAAA